MIGELLLSRYQISQVLGGGGFSDTYLAHDLALPGHPYCVVKHLRPKERQAGILKVAQALFEREATVLYQLGEHDLIPSLYAHFEQNQEFFLVQEYIEGHDIAQELLENQPLPERDVLQLLMAILEPLSVLHQEHFIHRDIKPHNLRRRARDGKISLIDFGAVKEIQDLTLLPSGETSRTIAVGSPGYMPAEQLAGRPKLASDIYAVGMIGIQALTGQGPSNFEEDPVTGELQWQQAASVSSALSATLQKMVHPYHLNRYPCAQEALAAISAIAQQTGKRPTTTTAQPHNIQTSATLAASASKRSIPLKNLIVIGGTLGMTFSAGVLYRPVMSWIRGDSIEHAGRRKLSPLTVVEDYYQDINERRLGSTWKRLTPEKQERGGGFRAYLEWWNTVEAVHIKEMTLEAESKDQAQVRVELWYGMKNGGANQESKNLITLQWHPDQNDWLIDRVN